MVGNALFADHIQSSYKIYPVTWSSVLLIFAVFVMFLLVSSIKKRLLPHVDVPLLRPILLQAGRLYGRCRLFIGITATTISLVGLSFGLNSYRYRDVGISETDFRLRAILLFVIVINIGITLDFFYRMFVERNETVRRFSRIYAENLLLAFSLVVAADGILSLLIALVASLYSISPTFFSRVLFRKRGHGLKTELQMITAALAFVLIFTVAWFAGTVIKVSSASDIATVLQGSDWSATIGIPKETFFSSFFYYFIERSSIFYYSFQLTTVLSSEELKHGALSVLVFPLQTLLFRIDFLLGGFLGIPKPEIGSIMGLNYELLVAVPFGSRPGTAPGVIASFNYVFGFPFNIIFCAIYLRWIARTIDILLVLHKAEVLSGFGIILLLIFLQAFFQSPFDLLIIIDGTVIYGLLVFAMYVAQQKYIRISLKSGNLERQWT